MSKQIDKYTYNTTDLLGIGSIGKVFKATEKGTNHEVGLKLIPKSQIVDDEALQQALLDEMQLMQKLKNPKIVQLLDVISSDSNYYIVMEYCKTDLQQLLKTQHKMPESLVVKMLKDLLEGFTELITHGVIHRDLKLSNVLFQDDVYKLTDCGFSKCLDNFKRDKQTTSHNFNMFMSPQLLMNEKFSNKCDIWSLGIILYNALFGYTPWFGRKGEELLHNIQHTLLDFPDTQVRLSEEMKSFIEGCLAFEEEGRFNWDDVFRHKLVSEHFKNYKSHIKDQQINFLMNDIRQKIIKEKLDVLKLFHELDSSGDQNLQFSEFVVLLKRIDKQLTRQDMQLIFKKLDLDGNHEISFDEFGKWLTNNNTKMTLLSGRFKGRMSTRQLEKSDNRRNDSHIQPGKSHPQLNPNQYPPQYEHQWDNVPPQNPNPNFNPNMNINPNRMPTPPGNFQPFPPQPQQDPFYQETRSTNNLEKTILRIKQSIQKYNINISDLFIKYDQDRDQMLNIQEFSGLVLKINPRLNEQELWQIFKIFDINEDQLISFIEFRQVLSLAVEKPPSNPNWNQSMMQIRGSISQGNAWNQPQYPGGSLHQGGFGNPMNDPTQFDQTYPPPQFFQSQQFQGAHYGANQPYPQPQPQQQYQNPYQPPQQNNYPQHQPQQQLQQPYYQPQDGQYPQGPYYPPQQTQLDTNKDPYSSKTQKSQTSQQTKDKSKDVRQNHGYLKK